MNSAKNSGMKFFASLWCIKIDNKLYAGIQLNIEIYHKLNWMIGLTRKITHLKTVIFKETLSLSDKHMKKL